MASARLRGKKWTALYRDPSGAQRSAGSFSSEEEALARATIAELDAGRARALAEPPAPVLLYPDTRRGKVTVAAYAPGWLDRLSVEPNTRLAYGLSLKHIIRQFGGMAVCDVQADDIHDLIRAMKKKRLSDSTVRHAVVVAKLMFRAAVRAKLRDDNPCEGIPVKVRDRREMKFATREQAKAIEDAVTERHKLLVRALFATGCRWGEMIAVKGSDVEARGTGFVLKIRRSVGQTSGVGLYLRNYGKTGAAERDITIPAALAKELMEFSGELCFPNTKGGYRSRHDFRTHVWLPAVKAAGIPNLRIHDTRHSHTSWLANDPRVPLAAVRDRLGHSSLAVTSKYVHVMPGDDDPCLAALGAT
jgi:integrase